MPTKAEAIAAWNRRASPSGGLGSSALRLATQPPAENVAVFKHEGHGAIVAHITGERSDDTMVEVQDMKDGTFNLTIHRLYDNATLWDDMTANLKPEHFAKLGTVGQNSTVAAQRGEATTSTHSGSLPKTAAPQVQDREEKAPMNTIITLGHGGVLIGHGKADGMHCVFLEPAPSPGTVGTNADDCGVPMEAVIDGAVIIRFDNRAGANVLVNALTNALAAMPSEPVAAVAAEEQGTPPLGVEPNPPPEGGGE